ncbi:hypothetical protein I5H85_gp064 [Mycobacterium phage Royals2015]|uniref:Uncharacterized protein n=1 Tax=Mycobacterium phage Royals2015 TaxID=2768139 RepID=A0A7G9W165_9CAUD|nr:hypothetical protein I5H85_gp064 [Mycobacterium phage Royals2015]QNO12378.1 hypothetical protein SEA_ROYALS2015_64 [Mycobacterium phage Royals2015]
MYVGTTGPGTGMRGTSSVRCGTPVVTPPTTTAQPGMNAATAPNIETRTKTDGC